MTDIADRTAERLRAEMTDRIVTYRLSIPGMRPVPDRVLTVMRHVPRHAFLPGTSLEEAYSAESVITKRAGDGSAVSCASKPTVVALMLSQLDVAPGDRVLEIGAGTGYNAALLAELTGPAGTRYDRLIVTVGPWDIPAAWWQQLGPGGRLVAPLRWRGQARSVAFARHCARLVSDWTEQCGFVPMTGAGQDGERTAALGPAGLVTMTWDCDQDIDPAALQAVLDQPARSQWSGEHIGPGESFDGLWLRLTATEPGACRLQAGQAAVDAGLRDPVMPPRYPAITEEASLAYLTLRRVSPGERRWELGAYGHGPRAELLADRICTQITAWSPRRAITAWPASTTPAAPGDVIISRPHTKFSITC